MGDVVVRGVRATVDQRRRGSIWLTVPIALVWLTTGVFVPAVRAASTDQTTPTSSDRTTTTTRAAPSTSTTMVTIPPSSVTTIASFPFVAPEQDAFPPSTMPREPEPSFDRDEDVALEPEPEPAEREPLPADESGAAPADANANVPAPTTTVVTQPADPRSELASPQVASVPRPAPRPAAVAAPEAAVDLAADDRAPSLFWPVVLAVGCVLLLCGPRVARRLRPARPHDVGHDVA